MSRANHILRCFALRESSSNDLSSGEPTQDTDAPDGKVEVLPHQTYRTDSSDSDVAKAVSDAVVDLVVSTDKFVYSVYDSVFSEDKNELMVIFFPSIQDFVNELTGEILKIPDVKSVQWSRLKPSSLSSVDSDVYYNVMKIKLNLISSVDLIPVKKAATKIIAPSDASGDDKDFEDTDDNSDDNSDELGGVVARAVSAARILVELQ